MRTDKQTFLDSSAAGLPGRRTSRVRQRLLRILVHVHAGQLARVGRHRRQRQPGVRRHRQRAQGLPAAGPEPRADSRPADHRRRPWLGRRGSVAARARAAAERDQLGERPGSQQPGERARRHRYAERVPHGQQRRRRRAGCPTARPTPAVTRSATPASR